MKSARRGYQAWVVSVLVCFCGRGSTARAQSFSGLGFLSGGTSSSAAAVNGDGTVVVGQSGSTSGDRAFRWTAAGGMVNMGTLPGGHYSSWAGGVSADGSVIVGASDSAAGYRAFRWTAAGGMVDLGLPPDGGGDGEAQNSYGHGVSGDGQVVAGMTDPITDGFRWSSAAMFSLGTLGGSYSDTYAANFDGTVLVGDSTLGPGNNAFRWTLAEGLVWLGTLPGGITSSARAISDDGRVIVGGSSTQPFGGGGRAFSWVADGVGQGGGTMTNLGVLPGRTFSSGLGVSADGLTVVGNCGTTTSTDRVFFWTSAQGMVDLSAYLQSVGVNMTGWTLRYAWGISADGRTIVGSGTHGTATEAWIARLPCAPPAIAAQPQGAVACRGPAAVFGVTSSGSRPFTYQWQVQTGPGVWTTVGNDPVPMPCGGSAYASPTNSPSVGIGVNPCPGISRYQVRCIVSNTCGSATSNEATLTICGADYDCNGQLQPTDVAAFVNTWFSSLQTATLAGDFDGNGVVNPADLASFVNAWFDDLTTGC